MFDNYKFMIPAGLRPVRTSMPETSTATKATSAPQKDDDSKVRHDTVLEASRAYYLNVARAMGGKRPLRLPKPRKALCCCMCAPRVKQDHSASGLELAKLLLAREGTRD